MEGLKIGVDALFKRNERVAKLARSFANGYSVVYDAMETAALVYGLTLDAARYVLNSDAIEDRVALKILEEAYDYEKGVYTGLEMLPIREETKFLIDAVTCAKLDPVEYGHAWKTKESLRAFEALAGCSPDMCLTVEGRSCFERRAAVAMDALALHKS